MTEAVQHKVSLGVFAGLIGVILAALLGFAPAPAQAASTGNFGGLQFDLSDEGGTTTSSVSFDADTNTVKVSNGDYNYDVTQVTLGQSGTATNIVIEGDYNGTITLNNVKLTNTAGSVITFNGSGATVVAASGTTLTGSNAGAATVVMPGIASGDDEPETDTLVVQSGATVINPAGNAAIQSGGSNGAAANVFDNVIELAGGSVTGGAGNETTTENGTNLAGETGAINVTGSGVGTTLISGTEATIVTGVSVSTVGANPAIKNAAPALTVDNTGTGDTDTVTILQGTAPITFQGGSSTFAGMKNGDVNGSAAPGRSGIVVYAGNLQVGGTYGVDVVEGGTIIALGGRGSDWNTPIVPEGDSPQPGQNLSFGGPGILVDNDGQVTVPANFTVNSGVVEADGGVGGSNNAGVTVGQGGNGIYLSAVKEGGTSAGANLNVNGGTLMVSGGEGGVNNANAQANGGAGITGSTSGKAAQKINIEFNEDVATEAPIVVAAAGKANGANALFNVAELNIESSSGDYKNNYKWVAYTTTSDAAPTATNPGTLQGFAGMTEASEGQMLTTLTTAAGADAEPLNWLCIEEAPLESIESSVAPTAGDGLPQDYVVAQTQATMSGTLPPAATDEGGHIYEPAFTATFSGLENVNTSPCFDNGSGLETNSATYEPANITSKLGLSSPNQFYIVKDATGGELTVNATGDFSNADGLTDIYGKDLTIQPAIVNVVYTVSVTNNVPAGNETIDTIAAGTNPAQTESNPVLVYTNPNGDGTLVYATGLDTTALKTQALQSIVVAAANSEVEAPAQPAQFIGLFNETVDPYNQVNNLQINGWDANAYLTAEWAAPLTLESVLPSPATLEQGASIDITATYTLDPFNDKITSYGFNAAGIDLAWDAVFVNTGFGAAEANGVTLEQTDSNTATGEQPFTVTSVATVAANSTADTGHYRVWPEVGQPADAGIGTPTPATGAKYSTIDVIAGAEPPAGSVTVWRLLNPNTGEHLYTTSLNEATVLGNSGWNPEGEAWIAPEKSDLPIFRLYNPNNGDHMYTISTNEYNALQRAGWKGEGALLYSAPNTDKPIFRLWCPSMTANGGAYSHLWTADYNEYRVLGGPGGGWQQEGTAFWALNTDEPAD